MFPVSSILCPSDGSQHSESALSVGVEIAEKFGAALHVLQVVQPVPIVIGSGYGSTSLNGFNVPMYEEKLVKDAEQELSQIVEKTVPSTVEVSTHIEVGLAADAINDFAVKSKIDLIVMATHGRSGLTHFMIGSVAEKTVRKSTVPVLIVPAKAAA
ncbi:universal stress protein [Desulfogranum marinum]|uniref:universal stress protein n=1 Tax=Desulfogranum marinum TaxID=453220 RepID=UPI0019634DC7|nr:universal stress protein [Desulfogranum marinum]MBM9512829.1 universal stress protein [Desulfogranum marinum]